MRIMREEPPRGRYWYQNVLLPLGRILKPKPLTAASQRKVWPVLGARARFTAASVRFFPMVISDSVSTAFCTPNLVWRATEQYGGIRRKIKASRGDARVLYGAVWGHKGQGFPGFEATTWHALVAPAGTPKDVIATLHRATAATVNDPPVRKALTDLGVDVV